MIKIKISIFYQSYNIYFIHEKTSIKADCFVNKQFHDTNFLNFLKLFQNVL